ncbi:MAG TPA: YitT family protein [Bacteroidia bacterium]|nr:YitT family protein [Bacteroidia bacterium]HRG52644.1 YitT family protein [Bacteroidia bacterium]
MNRFQQFFYQILALFGTNKLPGESNYRSAKDIYKLRVSFFYSVRNWLLIVLGILSATFGLESFLLPNSFIDGGVMGISLLVREMTKWQLAPLIVGINIPFLVLGYTQIGKAFAIKSIIAITGLGLALTFISFPLITSDKLLVAVFGGFFIGAGIGFAVRGGSVLDGTEVLAIYLSKRTGLTMGDIILVLNIIIFGVAAYVLSMQTAMYSVLAYLSASKTVDFIIVGMEEYTGITMVSTYSEEIRLMIIQKLGRGVTIYNGKRGYGKRGDQLGEMEIIYTVITRLEVAKLQAEVEKIDPNTFIVMNPVKDTRGGMIKKRPLH